MLDQKFATPLFSEKSYHFQTSLIVLSEYPWRLRTNFRCTGGFILVRSLSRSMNITSNGINCSEPTILFLYICWTHLQQANWHVYFGWPRSAHACSEIRLLSRSCSGWKKRILFFVMWLRALDMRSVVRRCDPYLLQLEKGIQGYTCAQQEAVIAFPMRCQLFRPLLLRPGKSQEYWQELRRKTDRSSADLKSTTWRTRSLHCCFGTVNEK